MFKKAGILATDRIRIDRSFGEGNSKLTRTAAKGSDDPFEGCCLFQRNTRSMAQCAERKSANASKRVCVKGPDGKAALAGLAKKGRKWNLSEAF